MQVRQDKAKLGKVGKGNTREAKTTKAIDETALSGVSTVHQLTLGRLHVD